MGNERATPYLCERRSDTLERVANMVELIAELDFRGETGAPLAEGSVYALLDLLYGLRDTCAALRAEFVQEEHAAWEVEQEADRGAEREAEQQRINDRFERFPAELRARIVRNRDEWEEIRAEMREHDQADTQQTAH